MKGCTNKGQRITELLHTAAEGRVTMTRGWDISHEFPLHVHRTYTIGVVESGARVIRHQGTETVVQVGAGFIIEPGNEHSCAALQTSGHTYTVISVERNLVEAFASEVWPRIGGVPRFREVAFHDRELFDRIRRLWNDQSRRYSTDHFLRSVAAILTTFFKRYSRTARLEMPNADTAPVGSRGLPLPGSESPYKPFPEGDRRGREHERVPFQSNLQTTHGSPAARVSPPDSYKESPGASQPRRFNCDGCAGNRLRRSKSFHALF